ncbi:hypothetical protein RZS28_01865 [Methylocapsa polymorpha]|uniref:DUF4760 domain-containing protein n=1 Tax=Methylocapsa polymorpha TaxID=3080828 RepID=A0ABZ0HW00_9HYPH|nr:hypothetical protein RZS28_01865 [Methylocapsa sp. RX1]
MILLVPVTLGIAFYSFDARSFSVNSTIASALAAAAAAVLNWAYQSGSRRIGAVDLFACEITVICRVCVVVNFAQSSVEQAEREHAIVEQAAPRTPQTSSDDSRAADSCASRKFTSEEHYTPVYDGQLSDLEPLDVNVVTYVTEFYTYRKTMMDYLRAIAAAENVSESEILMRQMIYMQFLMYESGRLAVGELIEFEPNRAESIVNILCSELVVYTYLQTRYENDYRGDRLRLRREEYQRIVPELYNRIMRAQHPSWIKAQTTAPELLARYKQMCSALRLAPGI